MITKKDLKKLMAMTTVTVGARVARIKEVIQVKIGHVILDTPEGDLEVVLCLDEYLGPKRLFEYRDQGLIAINSTVVIFQHGEVQIKSQKKMGSGMSWIQCERCGCAETTSLAAQTAPLVSYVFDWYALEQWEKKILCSACGPKLYNTGEPTGYGKWHGQFERIYLPMGMFVSTHQGDLVHKKTNVSFRDYLALEKE